MNKFSRRRFLTTSGAALAGLTLAPRFSAAQPITAKADRKIRIGIVGGNFGASFQWHEHPNCIVEAVSDLIPERCQKLMNVYKCDKSYPSLEELILDKNIEAVAIFTGAPDHVRHSVMTLKQGKHVCCAVPASMNIKESKELVDTVEKTGLVYMMAETSYYRQGAISARKWWEEGKFGSIYYCESEYHHPGPGALWFDADGKETWRHGLPPLLYPTHCTAFLVSITGERLVEVTSLGWGDEDPGLKKNQYNNNPWWNASAFYKTDKGNAFRMARFRQGAVRGCERAQWYGDRMSFFMEHPNGLGPVIVRSGEQTELDHGGFVRQLSPFEEYEQVQWWQTDMLPEPLRHNSGHGGSHTFLTHEFIDALVHERQPAINVYEALAYTVPGIVAHESSLKGGRQMKIPQFDPKA